MKQPDEEYIVCGDPAPPDQALGTHSLGELFLTVLQRAGPGTVALVDGTSGTEHTYADLLDRSIRLAGYLQDHGVCRGDVVAIVAENRSEYPVTIVALQLIGATAALLNPSYTARELAHALNVTRPRLVFVSSVARPALVRANRSTKHPMSVISYDPLDPAIGTTFNTCLTRSNTRPTRPAPVDVTHEVAIVVMSSGTTGLPKGVQITHRNVMATMANVRGAIERGLPLGCSLDVLPWFHVAGGIAMLSWLGANLQVVFLPRFEPHTYLRCIERYRPTFLNIVPPIAVFLAKHPAVPSYDVSSVQTIACGAAPLSREVEELIYARLPVSGLRIRQGYGMSETTQAITFYDGEQVKPGSIGKVRAGQQAKVIDPETGRVLGPNQHGELCFRGSLIMKGYLGGPEDAIDADGWLHTGDVGFYDEDRDFFIVDRLKELIKYNGFQVPPAELEALLLAHPAVKDCAVVGLKDERVGELPAAFVVLAEDQTNVRPGFEQQLIQHVAERVSNEKRLRGGVRFVAEIPKTASGKILRRALRELANEGPKSKL